MTTSNFQKHTSSNPIQKFLLSRYFFAFEKLIPENINNILDIGCGEGFLLEHLPSHVQYIGIDNSSEAIQLAKNNKILKSENPKKIQNIKFQKESVYSLPFSDNEFDLITCLEVLEHLKDYEKALSEIKRVAKKWIIISVPHEPWFQLSNFLRGKYFKRLGNHPEHINRWNPTKFKKLISKYFKIEKESYSFAWQIYLCKIN